MTALGINQKTLQAWIQESDINFRYDEIADEELDALVQKYYQENPTSGRAYIIGHLRAAPAFHIQHHRVMASMKCVDWLGQGLWQRVGKEKERTRYQVPRPNALWHIDGHHKLIAWGIVIHGVADGYTHKVCLLIF